MRTATPWWASLAFGIGLLLFLFGERFFGHLTGPRFFLTGLGVLLILGVTAVRGWAMMGTTGGRRGVERTLLISHLGTLLSLVLYTLTTDWAIAKLNLSDTGTAHFHGAVTVLFLAVLIASIVPLLMVELSLGTALRTAFDVGSAAAGEDGGVEYFRVREIGCSGLSVGLALSFLMVTCQVANERNVQRDVSYFKTSSPGDSTQKIIASSSDPIKVLLFFPEANEVKNQVKGYFDTLASRTGKLGVEVHDRLADAELAGKYKVTKDGTVVLVRGTGDKEKSQTLDVDIDIAKARTASSKLRNLDREVNSLLLKLARDKRKAYLTTGHGEVTDPDSIPPELKGKGPERRTTVLKRRLGDLNYEVKNLGIMDLAKDVPDDATIVMVMAPSVPLQAAEWAALGRYLDRGGKLFIALDPRGEGSMGELESRFALKMVPGDLTDEVMFLQQRGMLTDRRFAITNQFSAHASTTTLSRTSADRGLILIDSGALEDIPYTGKPEAAPKKTITIRSMETSFMDRNDNFSFDASGATPEKKQRWNIAAAIEGSKVGDKDGYRALVFADVDLFADAVFQSALGHATVALVSGPLLDDSIRWLGGEEAIVGDVVSEDDKPIQHTKNEDVVWFTLMIIGAPIIVLTLGLIGTTRRRRGSKKSEVTK
ncbi:MAG TPA: Gldg family protein [Kofleriaceae bacterium]|nr:Gldg family protein [Kofleriaceae bacterium]